ncbi:MAG: hypothetical protein R2827_02850 [Bdellovibrionales bacterium]
MQILADSASAYEGVFDLGPVDKLSAQLDADPINLNIDINKMHFFVNSMTGVSLGPSGRFNALTPAAL